MKKKLLLLFLPALCLCLLLGGLLAVHATAPEATTTIAGHNLSLDDSVRIIYLVDETAPENAETGVLCWTSPQESYTLENKQFQAVASGKQTISGKEYHKYSLCDISAKMMAVNVYAVSYVKVGNEVTYSKLDKYSILQYCYNKKGSTTTLSGGTATLGEMVTEILNYGATAQKYFNYKADRLANEIYYQVNIVNGTLGDGTTAGLYHVGESISLKATVPSGYQITWKNSASETVGTQAEITVTATAKSETYTAVIEKAYSQGLSFTSNGDGTCYVAGIGTCTDTDIVIPPTSPDGDTVTGIGDFAFEESSLTSATIPDSVTSIGTEAFCLCTSLTSITISDSVTSIGDCAFCWCDSLTSVTIPNNVTSIGASAFEFCTSLTSVTIGNNVTSIGSGAFDACPLLASITVAEDNTNYCSIDGILYNKPVTQIIHVPTAIQGNVTIPDGVISIKNSAFENCTSLTSVTIPNSITSIGNRAFYNCTSLTDVTIPDSVTSIGTDAFTGCNSTIIRKVQIFNDRQLVKNLNIALHSESEAPATMQGALDIVADYGYELAMINANAPDNEILWDSVNNSFCYFDKDSGIEYIPEDPNMVETMNVDYWVVSDTISDIFSTYYTGTGTTVTTSKGFDAGTSGVTSVNYTSTAAQTVIIRTYNDQCVLTVNAANSDVNFYGFAKEVNVVDVKPASFHIFGGAAKLSVTKGHVVIEASGIIFDVVQMGAADVADVAQVAATITNKGYIGAISLIQNIVETVKEAILADETKIVTINAIGGDFEIGTLAQLEAFRDAVNAGDNFAGKTVKLTADIELNDGWRPIGEGSRAVGKGNILAQNITTFFAGTFDGQNHTISNLNNNGFVPTAARLVLDDGVNTYAYGLFALVGAGAEIKNLKLTNVAIDTTTYAAAIGDSVGALIGYSHGSLTVTNIEVSGSIKSGDAVGGIIGRSYNQAGESQTHFAYSVTNCVNNATVTAGTANGQKGAGIVGFININRSGTGAYNGTGTFIGNINNGTISGGAAYNGTSANTYVASGEGPYVMRANLAIIFSGVNNLYYGTAIKTLSACNTCNLD